MPIKILMPALSPTMTEGNIARWLKNEGDKITPGEVIAEIETDKATMEIEAVDEGILAKIIIPQGTEHVPVNSLIALLLEEGENRELLDSFINDNCQIEAHDLKPHDHSELQNHPKQSNNLKLDKESSSIIVNSEEFGARTNDVTNFSSINYNRDELQNIRIFASPLAKKLAILNNINLSNIKGSGPHGRIIKQDVTSYLVVDKNYDRIRHNKIITRDANEYRLVPNSNIRKIIAKRLAESKQTIPHFYLSIECNIDKLLDAREDINKSFTGDQLKKISVNDFIILAVAKALKEVPAANASWSESSIIYYNNIDISVAVAIDNGLITPIIRNADQKDIIRLSLETKELITKARENKLAPEEFQGGNFSISNLGMYNIKSFSAIINPPQSCILAIGASSKRTIVVNDQIKIAHIMDVTLSSDHRVVDGTIGAQFLASFKKFIESPVLMVI